MIFVKFLRLQRRWILCTQFIGTTLRIMYLYIAKQMTTTVSEPLCQMTNSIEFIVDEKVSRIFEIILHISKMYKQVNKSHVVEM